MKKITILVVALLLQPLPASTEPAWPDKLDIDLTYRNSASPTAARGWELRFGGGMEYEPTYQGSDRNDTEASPFLVAAYRADWGNLFLSGDGLGYSTLLTDNFGLMLRLESEDTREVDDDERLTGLGNQDEELELEVVGRYFNGPWSFGASVATATGDKGTVWFIGGSRSWRLADERLFLTIAGDLSGSTEDNQQVDFGITPAQSLASGYPVYTPGGGLKSAGLSVGTEFQLTNRWYLYAELDYERLLGDVADSPVVFDENNIEIGAGIFYRF